ncbi:MAG TPA: S41 family peptidase [Gemmatimonas sp.]|uniref:S41 family peptidase n=1 Tax=Gemmatimonas sp. TaxID=1962908 RepID=UPI002EDB2BE2
MSLLAARAMTRLLSLGLLTSLVGCDNDHLQPYVPPADSAVLERTFTVSELQADLDTLFGWIADTHPALEARSPDSTRTRMQAELRARIDRPMTRRQYFRLIGSATSVFRDGHAGVLAPFPEYNGFVQAGGAVFPLQLARRNGTLEVVVDASPEQAVPRGAVLQAIDGKPVDSLLTHWASYARGESPVLREAIVLEDLAAWYWHLEAPDSVQRTYAIRFVADGAERVVQVRAVSRDSLAAHRKRGNVQAGGASGVLGIDSSMTGITWLDIPYFAGDEDAFERTVDQAIASARARRSSTLVVDVSRSPGGSTDQVEYLLARLTSSPCALVSKVEERINAHNRGLLGWRGRNGTLRTMNDDVVVQPSTPDQRFGGRIVALIGAPTYSAAIVFATAVRDCGIGLLAGEPTGGFANQTGQIHFRELPHTRLRAFAPTRALVRPNGKVGAEVLLPDLPLHPGEGRRELLARLISAMPAGAGRH